MTRIPWRKGETSVFRTYSADKVYGSSIPYSFTQSGEREMGGNTRISCVVLCYKGGGRIIPTLESCRLQTYKYKDIVVADDASPDNGYSASLIEKWLDGNKQYFTSVKFIRNPQNLGIVKNLQNASLHADGDIIFSLGQGDLCYGPDTLELIAREAQARASGGAPEPLVWLGYYLPYTLSPSWRMKIPPSSLPCDLRLIRDHPQEAAFKMASDFFIGACSIVYNKRYFTRGVFPIPEDVKNVEDWGGMMWCLLNRQSIGVFPFFIRWYENAQGISSQRTESFNRSLESAYHWIQREAENTEGCEYIADEIIRHKTEERKYRKGRLKYFLRYPLKFARRKFDGIIMRNVRLAYMMLSIPQIRKKSGEAFPKKLFMP